MRQSESAPWLGYSVAVLATGAAVLVRLLLGTVLGSDAPLLVFTLAVMLAAWYGGLRPGLFATALGALSGKLLFLPVVHSVLFTQASDAVRLGLFVLIGVSISCLSDALRRARLRAEEAAADLTRSQRELQAAYEREHRIAETLQRSLLVTAPKEALAGLDVEPFYLPAWDEAAVCGDFYDAFTLPGGEVALVVGDVSGKGLRAAARTAEVKYALRALLREYQDPAQALERLNRVLCDAHRLDGQGFPGFVALALALVDPATGKGRLAVAGAEPPLVLRAGGEPEAVQTGDLPLGVEPEETYTAAAVCLGPGDALLLVTDGLTEARRGKDFFGYEELARLAKEASSLGSARAMGQAILDGTRAFTGGALQDDACLLLARRP